MSDLNPVQESSKKSSLDGVGKSNPAEKLGELLGLSSRGLARHLGVSPTTITSAKRGVTRYPWRLALAIAANGGNAQQFLEDHRAWLESFEGGANP